uniref:Uncharacterized protein n=1 Tax=Arundo donax TaxID=35708 RepID=A0A0A9AZU5_ARUDO
MYTKQICFYLKLEFTSSYGGRLS